MSTLQKTKEQAQSYSNTLGSRLSSIVDNMRNALILFAINDKNISSYKIGLFRTSLYSAFFSNFNKVSELSYRYFTKREERTKTALDDFRERASQDFRRKSNQTLELYEQSVDTAQSFKLPNQNLSSRDSRKLIGGLVVLGSAYLISKEFRNNTATTPQEARTIRKQYEKSIPFENMQKKGSERIFVRNKNGKYISRDAKKYADLVTQSNFDEARWESSRSQTKSRGSRFVKVTDTGKSRAQYFRENDPYCGIINNQIYAVTGNSTDVATGQRGEVAPSGKFYQLIDDVVPGPFTRPHPYCKHFLTPISEAGL